MGHSWMYYVAKTGRLSERTLESIAKVLNVDMNELIEEEDEKMGARRVKVDAERIETILKEEKLKYAAVARLCGVSESWVTNMRAYGTLSEATLDKLTLILRVPKEELLAREEPKPEPKANVTGLEKKLEILSAKLDQLHAENLELKQKVESLPEQIHRNLSAEAWLFAKLKHNRDGISEGNLKVLAQNNGISPDELNRAMDTIGADRYKRNGNTWLSLYRTV